MMQFFCWKCDALLCSVNGEHFAISAWVPCPNEQCGEMNAVAYKFPEAKMESV